MASSNLFNLLPDEILLEILRYFLVEEEPFWIERCTELPRYRMAAWLSDSGFAPNDVCYPSRTVEDRLTAAVEPSQVIHAKDWLFVNSTCQRVRRLGKPLFFSLKQLAFTSSLPQWYSTEQSWLDLTSSEKSFLWERERAREHRRLTSPWDDGDDAGEDAQSAFAELVPDHLRGRKKWCGLSAEDRMLAVSQMRDIVILDVGQFSPSKYVKLPTLLNHFPKVMTCLLVMGSRHKEGIRPFVVQGEPSGRLNLWKQPITDLRELLANVGVSKDIEINVGVCKGLNTEYWRNHLVDDIFPMLRFRARLLGSS